MKLDPTLHGFYHPLTAPGMDGLALAAQPMCLSPGGAYWLVGIVPHVELGVHSSAINRDLEGWVEVGRIAYLPVTPSPMGCEILTWAFKTISYFPCCGGHGIPCEHEDFVGLFSGIWDTDPEELFHQVGAALNPANGSAVPAGWSGQPDMDVYGFYRAQMASSEGGES